MTTSIRCTIAVLTLSMSLTLLAGCGQDEPSSSAGQGGSAVPTAITPSAPLRPAAIDPGMVTVGVDRLLRDSAQYRGIIAVRGAVVRCFDERGAFVMVDLEEFKSCGLEACTDAQFPVRIARDTFEGGLPQPGEIVTLIGEFEPADTGYSFTLHEVHREGSVILAVK